MVKVSVIVAVYNPGEDINDLLASIDAQSLPPDEFEVFFADDDSTDGTRERLVAWAASRPHVQVLHNTPNSGWPGRPRNLGIDAATGEFLFFADNDDRLAPQALAWMYDYAVANDADIVIPKLVGVGPGRRTPRELFRRNIPDAKIGTHPIFSILTPHKLVRTAMVREHEIRFPEGPFRLEDHFFIVSCFFAARRISVLADKVCYYWMRRVSGGDNASFIPVDPMVYYRCLEQVLEIVEANTAPGSLRDQLYARWYDGKMLARMRGGMLKQSPAYQVSLFAEVRRVSKRFGLGRRQRPWLGAAHRLRAELVEHGTLAQVQALAEVERGVTSRVEVDECAWTDDLRLILRLRAQMVYRDGEPIRVVREGGAVFWDPSDLLPEMDLPRIDVTDLITKVRLQVMVTDRNTQEMRFVPDSTSRVIGGEALGAQAEVRIDPHLVGTAGSIIDLRARLVAMSWVSEPRIPASGTQTVPPSRMVGGLLVNPYATRGGNLSLLLEQLDEVSSGRTESALERWGRAWMPPAVRTALHRIRRG